MPSPPAETSPAASAEGAPTSSPGPVAAGPVYLALGDSLAAGVGAPPGEGYVDLVHAAVADGSPGLELVNLGVSGETTGSVLAPGGQLERAEAVLRERGDAVRLVTVDLGANDGWGCLLRRDPGCLSRTLEDVEANLGEVLDRLRAAGGEDLPVVGMDYYVPLPPAVLDDPAALERVLDLSERFRDGLRGVYAAYDVPVAAVGEAYGGSDAGRVRELACDYTLMCGPVTDIHPSPAGHRVIADEFLEVLPPLR